MLEITFLIYGEDFDVNLKHARRYIVFFKMVSVEILANIFRSLILWVPVLLAAGVLELLSLKTRK